MYTCLILIIFSEKLNKSISLCFTVFLKCKFQSLNIKNNGDIEEKYIPIITLIIVADDMKPNNMYIRVIFCF